MCATKSWTTPSTWKLRRYAAPHTARITLNGRSVAGPRGSVCGELTDPAVTPEIRLQDAGTSQSSISYSGSEAGQNMAAHSQRQGILSGPRIETLQTPHAMLMQGGEGHPGARVGSLVDIGALRGRSSRTTYFPSFGFKVFPWPDF